MATKSNNSTPQVNQKIKDLKPKKGNHPEKFVISSEEGQSDFMQEIQAVWFAGVCKKWKNTFGFVKGMLIFPYLACVIHLRYTIVAQSLYVVASVVVTDSEQKDSPPFPPMSSTNDSVPPSNDAIGQASTHHSKYVNDIVGREIFVHSSHLPDGSATLKEGELVELQVRRTA